MTNTNETLCNSVKELKEDIQYFEILGFEILANKFKRDLLIIEALSKNSPETVDLFT